ncbi:LMP1 [Symbiodinium sp. CCMP2592]|nr:LMP1 [Symbiodinium sp. CCMP2592]
MRPSRLPLSPSFPSWVASSGEQPGSPPKRKAEAEPLSAGAVEKRKAEEMAQGSQSSSSDSGDGGGSIRMVETVDAEWAEHGMEVEAEIAADSPEASEDPPSLISEELAVLDDAAELEEIDRLEKMTVLVDPVAGEEAEHLSTVFVKTWKFDYQLLLIWASMMAPIGDYRIMRRNRR